MKSKEILVKGFFGEVATSLTGKTTLIGSVFHGEQQLSVDELESSFFSEIGHKEKFLSGLESFNGFFTILIRDEVAVYLISDKVRSRPLFYTVAEGVEISDDFHHVLKSLKRISFNPLAREEFVKTGYVTCSETLFEDIFQLEAAQVVRIDCVSGSVEKQNYWYFIPEKNVIDNENEKFWFEKLDRALKKAVERLISVADGKKILIPLSGGYDSRAIALYLKKSGYKDLLAFTFGNVGSHEVSMSRRIAESLDIEWHCITYTREMWNKIKRSDDFKDYIKRIGSGVSVANVQVFPAVKSLIEKGVVDVSSVVVPGHAADFVAGSHFNKAELELGLNIEDAINMISRRHYKCSSGIFPRTRNRIVKSPLFGDDRPNALPIALTESWNCRERQSKFIANSNRYYDYFGLDWWMPFWDNDFISIWEEVPYSLRLNTRLWVSFVNASMRDYVGNTAPVGRSDPPAGMSNRIKGRLNYFFDPNGIYELVPFTRWFLAKSCLSKKPGTVFGYMAESYCNILKDEYFHEAGND